MISFPLIVKILEDPRTILGGVVLGFVFGFFSKEVSLALAPAGTIYIYLLSMCLLPIVVTAMIWGIGQMLRDRATRPLFGRLGLAYALGFIVSVAAAIVVAIAIGPGASLSEEAVVALGRAAGPARNPRQGQARGGNHQAGLSPDRLHR